MPIYSTTDRSRLSPVRLQIHNYWSEKNEPFENVAWAIDWLCYERITEQALLFTENKVPDRSDKPIILAALMHFCTCFSFRRLIYLIAENASILYSSRSISLLMKFSKQFTYIRFLVSHVSEMERNIIHSSI